jgi:hypothetical protein
LPSTERGGVMADTPAHIREVCGTNICRNNQLSCLIFVMFPHSLPEDSGNALKYVMSTSFEFILIPAACRMDLV